MLEIKGAKKGQRKAYYKPRSSSQKFWRGFARITIIVIVITAVLVGAAFIYAWYSSQHDNGRSTSSTVKPQSRIQKPHKPAPDAPIGVATQFLTNPVAPGDNASISIHTNADARCTISVKYDKTTAVDSGLMPRTADDYGLAQWSWTIPASAPLGNKNSSVEVLCSNTKHTGRIIQTLIIEAAKS